MVRGIDTDPGRGLALVKLDVVCEQREDARETLRELGRTLSSVALLPALKTQTGLAAAPATAVIGFSARFFRGPLTPGRDALRGATRLGIDMPVPSGLKRMYARGDERFPAMATDERLAEKESDLVILLEADEQAALVDGLSVLDRLARTHPVRVRAIHRGFRPESGKGHLGFRDGISNLQEIRRTNPAAYARYVYVHDGEAGAPAYDGGTYLVFRKYAEHVDRWSAASFTVPDREGKPVQGAAARAMVIGRCPLTDQVIDRDTGEKLAPQFDESQGARAFLESHIRQANPRGAGTTNFGAPVVVRDARILRRSFSFREEDEHTGKCTRGLIFLCFQGNIVNRGFEFIHNEWLMSKFMGTTDHLLDPDSGIVEPVDGCYYFVPPAGKDQYPGGVFFDD